MKETTNNETNTTMSESITANYAEQIAQLTKERDEALDKLSLSEAQVVQLLDENNSLKLDYSHSEAENAKLAAQKKVLVEALEYSKRALEYFEADRFNLGCGIGEAWAKVNKALEGAAQ